LESEGPGGGIFGGCAWNELVGGRRLGERKRQNEQFVRAWDLNGLKGFERER